MNALVAAPAPRAFSEPGVVAGATPQALVPTSFEGVFRMAQVISASGMAPKGMDTPEACTVAILNGLEIGLTPMQAVQLIAIVNGRPTVWGDAAKALCLGSPMCEDIVETLEGTGDYMVARCVAKRKGKSPSIGEFSVAKAKKAGLWNKSGPWQQYPERMLQVRARAFALRDAFPDVLRGVAIREEMEDVADVRDVTPPPAPPPAPPVITAEPARQSTKASASAPPIDRKAVDAEITPPPAQEQSASAAPEPAHDEADAQRPTPDEILANLVDVLSNCTTLEAVEEGYTFTDVEADLQVFDGYVAKARNVKASHIRRVEALIEKAAPAAPPAPSLGSDDEPEAFADIAAYENYARNLVADWDGDRIGAWWKQTRGDRQRLDMSHEKRVELQAFLENRIHAANARRV